MEQIYALGINFIQFVQYWFQDYEQFFKLVNNVANPYYITEVMVPVVSVFDSVFAAQLLLCMAFGSWLNAVMKWWFLEDRPYWWVRETTYYEQDRPVLRQTLHTCETGPGSPSGHSCAIALTVTLLAMCVAHVANDRKCKIPWWMSKLSYPILCFIVGSVMMARIYVAAHFPHQVILGALSGLFLAPVLCLYVSDPFIWRYGIHSTYPISSAVRWHIISALLTIVIALFTYFALKLLKIDPMFTIKLAFRWCENPESIHVTTTPMFVLVQSTAYLLGWAISVTPAVAQYRHNTKDRSLIISAFTTSLVLYILNHIDSNLCKSNTMSYYVSQFIIFAIKPMLLLRVVPAISMYPFSREKSKCD